MAKSKRYALLKQYNVRFTNSMLVQAKTVAREKGLDVSTFIRLSLQAAIKEHYDVRKDLKKRSLI